MLYPDPDTVAHAYARTVADPGADRYARTFTYYDANGDTIPHADTRARAYVHAYGDAYARAYNAAVSYSHPHSHPEAQGAAPDGDEQRPGARRRWADRFWYDPDGGTEGNV